MHVRCNIPSGSERWDWCPGPISTGGCAGLDIHPNLSYEHPIDGSSGQAAVSIVSSSLSCLGSLLIVFSYWKWKDIRTGSRSVVTFLAIADFFTAFGYIIGSANFVIHNGKPPGSSSCVQFNMVCKIQSFITSWSSLSSFLWTAALALYLYCTIARNRVVLASKLIPYFHVICWGAPILICLPLLISEKLGHSPYAAATWCYIAQPPSQYDDGLAKDTVLWLFLGGKFWEILSYFLVVGLYIAIKVQVRKQTKIGESENILSAGLISVVKKADRKLTFIPIVFVLLRIWGTIQFFYSLAVSQYISCACTTQVIATVFTVLTYFQAIGDGGQGWGNVFLYVLASDKIRTRLLGQLFCPSNSDDYPPRRIPDVKPRPIDRGNHHHAANQPLAVDVQNQVVSYQSTVTHEATTPIN
ncbi:G-protein coupled receptor 157-like [Halichondria panicea]|uniref:G-protein coupled receptor 157-like n=1 Tax=Halichondria panicea TaxID=6063 RepID=UPI00312B9C3A